MGDVNQAEESQLSERPATTARLRTTSESVQLSEAYRYADVGAGSGQVGSPPATSQSGRFAPSQSSPASGLGMYPLHYPLSTPSAPTYWQALVNAAAADHTADPIVNDRRGV
eukprot:3025904-Amphidinium_carterae.3